MNTRDLLQSCRDELADNINYLNGDIYDIDDEISQLADNNIPVYNRDILDLAVDNIHLVTSIPELASGGETPLELILLNIFELIQEDLYEYWNELESDWSLADHDIGLKLFNVFLTDDTDMSPEEFTELSKSDCEDFINDQRSNDNPIPIPTEDIIDEILSYIDSALELE